MLTYLIKGGPIMIPIGLLSILAGAFAITAWIRISSASKDTSKIISELSESIQKRDWTRALKTTARYNHPFLKSWCTALILLIEGKSDLRDIEETISIEGSELVSELESPLKPLGAITTALPMFGFLGTILGLIVSFHQWEQFGAQVSIGALAGGIYQAMITTAAGLITAIPYLLAYHHFHARIEKIALELSKDTTQLFRWIKDALLREIPIRTETLVSTAHEIQG